MTKLLLHNTLVPMPALQFREDKATQVAARLLELGGRRMNLLKLVKLVYLADREALVRWGRPITMDFLCSMPHGTVVSNVLSLINEQPDPENPRYWHRFISERRADYNVSLVAAPGVESLSKAEEEAILAVFRAHGAKDQWQLRDYTHTLPEWHDPEGSMLPIDIGEILSSAGYQPGEIAGILEELDHISRVDRALR